MKKIITCVLSLFLLLSLSACKKEENKTQEHKSRINSSLIVDYVHYEDDAFYDKIKEVTLLIEKGDVNSFVLYDELFDELKLAFDYLHIANINFDIDYRDEYWSNEYNYLDQTFNGLRNAFLTMTHQLTDSDIASSFKEHINNELLWNYYSNYVTLSDEMISLQNKDSSLVNEYMSLDYDAENYYEEAGRIFIELLQVRSELATALGYDNYIEYTDSNLYDRDYVSSDLKAFYQAAKDMNFKDVEKANKIINETIPEYNVDGAQSLLDLKKTIEGVSPYLDEAYEQLSNNNLYWYDNSEFNNGVGYTIAFMSNYTPYIFNNLVCTSADLFYQVHELGHFVNFYNVPNDALIFYDGNYDLLEIQSQGLELLCLDNINQILDVENSPYRYKELYWCLSTIVDGCLIDEWSREVYSHPDMTLEEIDDLFNQLAFEYGKNPDKSDMSDEWKDIVHNFTDPGYYVSYATSMFAAAQLYNTSLINKDLAIEQYNKIVLMDSKMIGYFEAVQQADMVLFTDYENTLAVLNNLCDRIVDGVN